MKERLFRNKITLRVILMTLISFSCIICYGQNTTLNKVLDSLMAIPSNSLQISQEEMKMAEVIHGYGIKVVPELIKFLKSQDPQVRKKAAYTLSLFESIDEIYLDDLVDALNKGEECLAPKIAGIGTDVAISSLIEALKKNNKSETIAHSFELLGSKCVPYLIKVVDCKTNCDYNFIAKVSSIFGYLGKNAVSAVSQLDSIALNQGMQYLIRKSAVISLGNIGIYAKSADKDIYQLGKNEISRFSYVAQNTLWQMKSPLAVELMLNYLESTFFFDSDKILFMRDLSSMGADANKAGERILKYLDHDNRDLRIATARTLGFIGYKPAVPELIKRLKNEDDWRLSYVSVKSLEMLQAKDAVNSLKEIESDYWYSLVRDAAKKARKNILESTPDTSINSYKNFGEFFFSYESDGNNIKNCKIQVSEAQKELNCWSGFLSCDDKGPYDGFLKFKDSVGKSTKLVTDNVKSIFKIDTNIIAIAGYSSYDYADNYGRIYKVINSNDTIVAKKILVLPGNPIKFQKLKNDELMIVTIGGTVILSKDLKLRQATCKENQNKE